MGGRTAGQIEFSKKNIVAQIKAGDMYLPASMFAKYSCLNIVMDKKIEKMVADVTCYRVNGQRFTCLTTASQREIVEIIIHILLKETIDEIPAYTEGF